MTWHGTQWARVHAVKMKGIFLSYSDYERNIPFIFRLWKEYSFHIPIIKGIFLSYWLHVNVLTVLLSSHLQNIQTYNSNRGYTCLSYCLVISDKEVHYRFQIWLKMWVLLSVENLSFSKCRTFINSLIQISYIGTWSNFQLKGFFFCYYHTQRNSLRFKLVYTL